MSAITGIFYRDGRSVSEDEIKKMNNCLSHRGPDGSAIWCEGSIALGHQMLHTTPESLHEQLPFEEDGLVITADARIDNRKELSEKLGIEDKEEVSDSYFILKAYEEWGEKCPEELLGDFSFAIWDKDEEKLFCARDHMGVKPFYYYLSDNVFLFATEIKALFSSSLVPKKINKPKIAFYIALTTKDDRDITFYENILRLPAANIIKIKTNAIKLNQYWELNLNNYIHLDSDEEYEMAFLDIFTEAVHCRLRSAFPVGSMLSGGLDSSSIACIAQKILISDDKKLKTFSAVFDSVKESNERHFIEKAVDYGNFDSYLINADEIDPLYEVDKFLWCSDTPYLSPNTFLNWNICKEAQNKGVNILLTGFEGDTTVSHGLNYFADLFRNIEFRELLHEIISSKKNDISILRIIYFHIFFTCLPSFIKRNLYLWREKKRNDGSRSRLVNEILIDKFKVIERIMAIYEEEIKVNNAHELHFLALKSPLIQNLMELVDWQSASFSLEMRHPFFDKRLVEFCLAIPTEQKFSDGWSRSIMRRAMNNILPVEIQWRKDKSNLSYNFDCSFRKFDEKKLENIILNENNLIKEYFNIKNLEEHFYQFKSENSIASIYLWYALILSLWLEDQ